jgi:hypothetical protein
MRAEESSSMNHPVAATSINVRDQAFAAGPIIVTEVAVSRSITGRSRPITLDSFES